MKMKNRKNTLRIVMALCVLTVVYLASCARGGVNRVEVRIEVQDPFAVDFDKYDKIVYKGLTIETNLKNYNPDNELKEFFLQDLPKALNKTVEPWDEEKSKEQGEMSPGVKTVVLTGTLKLDVKERSKIEEVEDKAAEVPGKKKRAFVAVQHWDLKLTVILKDAADGAEVFNEEFNEKLANVDPENAKFNFEKVFFQITNRLVKKLTKSTRVQRRYLLH